MRAALFLGGASVRGGPATVTGASRKPGHRHPCHEAARLVVVAIGGRGHPPDEGSRGVAVPVQRCRRDGRHAPGPHPQRDLAVDRWCARARREGHGQVDGRPGPGRGAAAGLGPGRLPLLVRPGRPRPALPGRPARRRRHRRHPHREDRRAAGRLDRGPAHRLARRRTGADRGRHVVPARPARCSPPRRSVRRRGQPAARPPGRPAPRRRRPGHQLRRTRRGVGAARGPVPARGHDEPRGGRTAPAAARPVRADRRGGRAEAAQGPGRGGTPADGVRRRPARVRGPLRRRGGANSRPRSGLPAWCCRRSNSPTARWSRSRPFAPRSTWTGCGPTS